MPESYAIAPWAQAVADVAAEHGLTVEALRQKLKDFRRSPRQWLMPSVKDVVAWLTERKALDASTDPHIAAARAEKLRRESRAKKRADNRRE